MRKSNSTLLPTIAALLASGAFGAAAAAAAVAFASERQVTLARLETASAVARAKLLESVIRRQAGQAVSLVSGPELAAADLQTAATADPIKLAPAAPREAAPKPAPAPAATVAIASAPVRATAAPKAESKALDHRATIGPAIAAKGPMPNLAQPAAAGPAATVAPATGPAVATPTTTAAATTATAANTANAAATRPLTPASEPDVVVVTPETVAAARKNNRIEGVDGAKLGVLKLDPAGVELKNGRTIHPGGKFPSGERLLAIDQANGQIVTDRRTILVF